MRKREIVIMRKRKMMKEMMAKEKLVKKASKKKKIDADVNKDGVVDEKDVKEVKKRIVKKKD